MSLPEFQDTFYLSTNQKTKELRNALANSLKYAVEVGSRQKNVITSSSRPFSSYGVYISIYSRLHMQIFTDSETRECSPEAFIMLISTLDKDMEIETRYDLLNSVIHEALYLASKIEGKEMKSLNSDFLGVNSIDNWKGNNYKDFLSHYYEGYDDIEDTDIYLSSEDDFLCLSDIQN